MSAPIGKISPWACIGQPPEHREARLKPDFGVDIHPAALLEAFVTVDAGRERPTRICAGAWLMKHVHIGHDADIGPDCELSPGAVICGHATLERGVRLGVNASILPFRHVGEGARIGAGAVVTHDVPPGEVWVGVPARDLQNEATRHLDCHRRIGELTASLLDVCERLNIDPPDGAASLERLRRLEELRDLAEHGSDLGLAAIAAEVRRL